MSKSAFDDVDDFYMYLRSDFNAAKGNNPLDFSVLLPQTIDLASSSWRIGLTELLVDAKLENFSSEDDRRIQYRADGATDWDNFLIPADGYETPHSLATAINQAAQQLKGKARSCLNIESHFLRGWTTRLFVKRDFHVMLPDKMADIFCVKRDIVLQGDTTVDTPARKWDLHPLVSVNCDLAGLHMISGTFMPSLRLVPMLDDWSHQAQYQEFHAPHYVPLNASCFDVVHVELKSVGSIPMRASQGRTVVGLHFVRD